ncbi:hypothetical protein GCM10010360_00090 [Streptomyces nogalater]
MTKAAGRYPVSRRQAEADTSALRGEYTTYAPRGEKCRRCHKPFGGLEPVRRVQPSGEEPNGRLYTCVKCPA